MKKLCYVLLLLVSFSEKVFPMCMMNGIYVWPQTHDISSNSLIVIEGYESSQLIVTTLNTSHAIYLKSGNSIIPLQVIKLYESEFRLTQALLKPATPLIAGTTYSLQIDSLGDYEKADFLRENFHWIVSDKPDHEAPAWYRKPVYAGKKMTYYGCGPAPYVNFCACIRDDSPVLVFTRLKELKTGKVSEYYVTPDSTMLKIGHGMCSGDFDFREGEDYEISFSLMDACGNTNDTLTQVITFVSPTDKDLDNEDADSCECPTDAGKKESTNTIAIILFAVTGLIIAGYFAYYSGMRSHRRKRM